MCIELYVMLFWMTGICAVQSFASTDDAFLIILDVLPLVLCDFLTWLCDKYSPELWRVTIYGSPDFRLLSLCILLLFITLPCDFVHLGHPRLSFNLLIWDSAGLPFMHPFLYCGQQTISRYLSMCNDRAHPFLLHCPFLTRAQCH